ncbi:MAG: pilus assembly protein N-terminal domain-containing protein, partial [Thermoguttaceae bacterium]
MTMRVRGHSMGSSAMIHRRMWLGGEGTVPSAMARRLALAMWLVGVHLAAAGTPAGTSEVTDQPTASMQIRIPERTAVEQVSAEVWVSSDEVRAPRVIPIKLEMRPEKRQPMPQQLVVPEAKPTPTSPKLTLGVGEPDSSVRATRPYELEVLRSRPAAAEVNRLSPPPAMMTERVSMASPQPAVPQESPKPLRMVLPASEPTRRDVQLAVKPLATQDSQPETQAARTIRDTRNNSLQPTPAKAVQPVPAARMADRMEPPANARITGLRQPLPEPVSAWQGRSRFNASMEASVPTPAPTEPTPAPRVPTLTQRPRPAASVPTPAASVPTPAPRVPTLAQRPQPAAPPALPADAEEKPPVYNPAPAPTMVPPKAEPAPVKVEPAPPRDEPIPAKALSPKPVADPMPAAPPVVSQPAPPPSPITPADIRPAPVLPPVPAPANLPRPEGAGPIVADGGVVGPFEVIEESGEMTVMLRRSKLLRTRVDIYRTAVVDPSICDVVQFTPREISLVGKGQGATHITFWFDDKGFRPITYLVRVVPDPEVQKRREEQYGLMAERLAELFPNSKIEMVPLADKLIVRGQARDAAEAAQIMAIIRGEVINTRGIVEGRAADPLSQEESGRPLPATQVINMLRIPGVQQVALRVKIAELNRSAARNFGVDMDMSFADGKILLKSLLNTASGGTATLIGNLDGGDINFGIHYLEKHGVMRMLSEPT